MKKRILFVLVMAIMAVIPAHAQNRELQVYKDGRLIQSFPISAIDSIKVGYSLSAPGSVSARLTGKSIVVSWSAVTGAQTYRLYRSGDNVNFTLLASNISGTSYTDNSPLPGTNYYKVKALGSGTESAMSEGTGTATLPSSGLESGLYLGVMSFNQELTSQPISILNAETKSTYDAFINAMTMKNGTVLCYSVDQAINALQSATLPDDIFSVAIVTFTDGLDQGSLMIDDRFDSDDDYLAAIQQRITGEMVAGQSISAYSIGLRGSDVTSASDIYKFRSTLRQLASSDANATDVSSMAEVNARFQEIAAQLNSTSYLQTISLKIPGLSNGTRVRFTFDNVGSANYSNVYIEGTFNLRSRSLTDVEYHGMTSTSGTTIQGTTEGIFVTFKFEGIQTANGKLLSSEYIDEWYMTSSNSWQVNSEFDKDENSDVLYEKKSAVIMLVLDCSSSLGSQFSTMQTNAKSFVATLCQLNGDGGDNTATIQTYMGVKGGNYNEGNLPGITDTETQVGVTSNNNALAGGANIVTVESPVPLRRFFAAIEGLNGYYDLPATPVTRAEATIYIYDFTITYTSELDRDMTIIVRAEKEDGGVIGIMQQNVTYVSSQSGDLTINLVFDQEKDVDLHLFMPEEAKEKFGNNWIYYGNRGIYSEGVKDLEALEEALWQELLAKYNYHPGTDKEDIDNENFWIEYEARMAELEEEYGQSIILSGLDHDSNPSCSIDGLNNENIVIKAEHLVPGTYKVYINMWENCTSEQPTKWTCMTRLSGNLISATEGANPAEGEFEANAYSNDDDEVEKMTLATTFTITQAQIDAAKAGTRASSAPSRVVIQAAANQSAMMKLMDSGKWDNMKHHRRVIRR